MGLLEHLFALNNDPTALLAADGTIVRANDAWRAVLGFEAAALTGTSFLRLMSEAERGHFRAWLAAAAESAGADAAPSPRSRHTNLSAANGEQRPMLLRLSWDAETSTACLVARLGLVDNDELKHLRAIHQRWDALSRTLSDFVVTSDTTGMVLTINREPPGIPIDALVGQPESMFTPIAPEERPALRERFAQVISTGDTLSYETQVAFPNGTIGTFESHLGPIYDGATVTGAVLITRDLTVQRQAEEARRAAEIQIREYTVQLERSNSELERFASVASHDLQEPLRKIQAFGDRLRQKYGELLPEAGRDYVNRMQEAAKRMQDLINDLLMFSRLTTKEQRFSPVQLGKILTAVLSDLEVRVEENDAKIEVGNLPTIEADPVHMRQLFQNLLSNALKFRRPEVAPVIKITVDIVPGPGKHPGFVRLTFSDNGIGIDAKYHERIFGIFERLHSRGKYEGTGVGLAVCRKICDQHGGSIRVDSSTDGGSAFIAELPVRQERK